MVLFVFLTLLVAFINYSISKHSLICMNQLLFQFPKAPLQKLKSINFISESCPLDKTIFILFSLVTREWPHGLDSPLTYIDKCNSIFTILLSYSVTPCTHYDKNPWSSKDNIEIKIFSKIWKTLWSPSFAYTD